MQSEWLVEKEGGVLLRIHLQPGAKKTAFAGFHGGALKLLVQAPPVQGAANAKAIEFMAQLLKVSKSRITLVKGSTSRQKLFHIAGVAAPVVREVFTPEQNPN